MDKCAGALQIFICFLEIHKEFEIATEIRLRKALGSFPPIAF
jgi:hypothetical protein